MLRKTISTGAGILVSTLVLGCASAPAGNTSGEAATAAAPTSATSANPTQSEPKVVQTTAQAKKYATEEEVKRAYRECMRKMRRITGSRIPRNACQGSAGLYSGAYNQQQEGLDRGSAAPSP